MKNSLEISYLAYEFAWNSFVMIERPSLVAMMQAALKRSRIVDLMGPCQSGKITLAQMFVPFDSLVYSDLEDPVDLIHLEEPMTALRELTRLVVDA